ncbi:MAG: excinuclease ABC subunit UvrB [Planctomycetaceae bacterium]|jgi:excinuclease ABC subunit B|nr:excinuclease ABC subunit UvrB [Planctomycetaceae bacterium]
MINIPFEIDSQYTPAGDQPQAIRALTQGLRRGVPHQVLMGVTGSGKTFTMANVIEQVQRPTLILSHNKTLAAQLYSEFREFFPRNAVHYFISYYDYYQPEAYIPQKDLYIEKDSSINEEIERLRLAATSALITRRDCIIVASVSCIFGLGSPEMYSKMVVPIHVGDLLIREELLLKLVNTQYSRNEINFERGKFRIRGDTIEIWPPYEDFAIRLEFWGNEVEKITFIQPETGEALSRETAVMIYPAKHFVTDDERIYNAIDVIRKELAQQLAKFQKEGKILEAQRLESRTKYDLEMLSVAGHCPGIENYSRPLSGKPPGATPDTLHDFFPKDFFVIVDESHVTIPQIRAMYFGDQNRKKTLVDHGFRLPCAMDNRPLKFEEWEQKVNQVVFVSATPGDYELEKTGGEVVEQVIRPTGLLDPVVEVVSAQGQINHLLAQIKERVAMGDRVLVTALTKRLAEDLSNFFCDQDVKCRWLHSELDAFERVELLRDLREGHCDVIVGVNLLREGLDLPEVSLVAILDADKEGFLRSETSLIQTIGRAARNVNSKVILYADRITQAMQIAIEETSRRRKKQEAYNLANNITPATVRKQVTASIQEHAKFRKKARDMMIQSAPPKIVTQEYLKELEQEMMAAAEEMEFERAAAIRDKIQRNRNRIGQSVESPEDDQKHSEKSKSGGGFKQRRQRGGNRGSKKVNKDRDSDKDRD